MVCPTCSHTNAEELVQCEECSTPLPFSDQTIGTGLHGGWSVPASDVVVATALKPLIPGTILGERYEIIRLLGRGGMGAVYQAHDRELDRQVALKVIRKDMAANPEILRRFKQELILARQITHKNVIRIFDLGQADGIKFITMEYIEGQDLQGLLKQKKKLEPAEAAKIIAQVCRALEVAHAEGVIHRDLKPQNIMLDKTGRVYVMDFGIARSTLTSSMTQTGALIGTPDYMSPEQAKGQAVDARSDLFAIGIIFYEILSGQSPYIADTTMGKLWKRTSEPARPLGELDKTIPQPLAEIVKKCLEIDPQKRFASATELLHAIEDWQGPGVGTRITVASPGVLPGYAKWIGVGLVAFLVAAGIVLRPKFNSPPAAPHAPVTLLIADFDNKTGDAVFDGTLEPMLGIALEGAPFISSYNRGQAKKVAAGLQRGTTRMDGPVAELVAVREGIDIVIAGVIAPEGNGYRVQVTALDATTGKPVMKDAQMYASNKQEVLEVAGKLADRVRKGLGDTTSTSQSAAETYTAASLQAAHEYAVAQNLQQAGKWTEAIETYRHATELDPEMGRAYAGLAAMYANLGQRQQAEKSYQLAMAHIDRMTDREKYRTRSGYYLLMKNHSKAADELAALVERYPADTAGRANLAFARFQQRDMGKALEEQRRVLTMLPHSVLQRSNLSLYALYAGDFDTAATEAGYALQDNPTFEAGARTLALAKLAGGHIEEAKQEYGKLEAMSPRGASMAATGLADLALYEGRLTDAIGFLEKGIAMDLAAKDPDSVTNNQATLALTQVALNRSAEASASAAKAAAGSKDEGVLYRAA